MAEEGFLFKILRQAILEWVQSDYPGDRIFKEVLKEHRLGSSERHIIAERFFRLLRFAPLWRIKKEELERPPQMRTLEEKIRHYWKMSFQELLKEHSQAKPFFEKDPEKHLRKVHGIPDFLVSEIRTQFEDWHNYFHEMLSEAPMTLRFQSSELLEKFLDTYPKPLAGRSPWLSTTLYYFERWAVNSLPEFESGEFEIQDEHSQMVSLMADPQPGEKVLDLCAGAGGKTLHLASLMGGTGEVWAYDISQKKLVELAKRARRAKLSNVRTLTQPPRGELFDVVVVDSPCSSLGTLRRSPDRILHFSQAEADQLRRLQSEILTSALKLMKPKGRLIYSTCTVRRSENILLVEEVIKDKGKIFHSLVPQVHQKLGARADSFLTLARESSAGKIGGLENFDKALQLGPSANSQTSGGLRGDGFFIAQLK